MAGWRARHFSLTYCVQNTCRNAMLAERRQIVGRYGPAARLVKVNDLDCSTYAIYTWSMTAAPEGHLFAPQGHFSKENCVVTKKEIVKTISDEIGLTQLKTKEIVQKTFDAIVETLVEERRIELRNFGVFEVKKRAARKARNPRTGDKVYVPEKFVVTFKPGKEMEERVRELERQAAAAQKSHAAPAASARGAPPRPTHVPETLGAPIGYSANPDTSG